MNNHIKSLLESHRQPEWDSNHWCFTVARLVKRFDVKTMAEVGVCFGHTAAEVLALNQVEKYFMVDSWENEANYLKIRNNFHDKSVEIFREDSMSAVGKFEDGSLDLVCIAGISYKRTVEDLRGWYKKLRYGGILVGDGFNPDSGVKEAVYRVFQRENVNVNMSNDSNYWVFME